MLVSQKCEYALRAVFELSRCNGRLPVKIVDIADAQAIPHRFLEVIMNELKQGGFVESRRGRDGGYLLARPAETMRVGEVIGFVEGPLGPVDCVESKSTKSCRLYGNCALLPMWEKVRDAISGVYDNTTFQDLVNEQMEKTREGAPCYSI